MKKIISVIFIIALISSILISCGENSTPNTSDNNNINNIPNAEIDQDGVTEENPIQERIDPELPEKDFEGYTFTFLAHRIDYQGDWTYDDPAELVAEEETGDTIIDAVYKRNMTIAEICSYWITRLQTVCCSTRI